MVFDMVEVLTFPENIQHKIGGNSLNDKISHMPQKRNIWSVIKKDLFDPINPITCEETILFKINVRLRFFP